MTVAISHNYNSKNKKVIILTIRYDTIRYICVRSKADDMASLV